MCFVFSVVRSHSLFFLLLFSSELSVIDGSVAVCQALPFKPTAALAGLSLVLYCAHAINKVLLLLFELAGTRPIPVLLGNVYFIVEYLFTSAPYMQTMCHLIDAAFKRPSLRNRCTADT